MEQEREQFGRCEVETRQPNLDQGIELLGQEPEVVGTLQAAAFGQVGDAVEMLGRRGAWHVGQGGKSQELVEEKVEQEFASPVGEGANPLPDGRAGWTAVGRPSLGFQRLHQATPAQASDETERDSQLQQVSSIESMGVHKVRQQTVCAATDLAPHALNPDAVVAVGCAGPPLVGAPTNQRIGCSAFRVWAAVWQGKAATWKGDCFGVLLDGIGKVLYNDHVVGTPPLVVKLASSKARREVSSFLPQ